MFAASVAACAANAPVETPAPLPADYVACPSPRPQVCTREYRPVCAQRDTGVRCVTQPCPSADWFTAGNACSACADEKVLGYRPGACR